MHGFSRLILSLFLFMLPIAATAQLDPQPAFEALQTAPGLEVSLFAHEPELINPTCIDVDALGRVWVCEAANYRLFNQDETRPEGDRIRILEDTDGDGKCDKATTFYQDPSLQAPMGIAVLGDRVYLCQSPDLFYLEDTDNDGVADKRTTVLTGFKGVDNDHAIHGIVWGPDNRLYFSNGDKGLDVTDKSGNRVHVSRDEPSPYRAAAVLRSDVEGQHIELLGHNMRNPYEPCVDVYGTVFISDNDDDGNEQCRINYVMDGGDYGYTPRRRGNKRFDAIHWNEDRAGTVPKMIKTGFGSPCGMMYYTGAMLPSQYQRTLLHADAGPRVIRSYTYGLDGAGYTASLDIMLSAPEDSWFRPVDVCAAPDGSLFVADWYDPGVGGHRMGDVTRGRIYRITSRSTAYSVPPLELDSYDGLKEAYLSPNIARRYLAYVKLTTGNDDARNRIVEELTANDDPEMRMQGLWLLAGHDETAKAAAMTAHDQNPRVRIAALRIAPAVDAPWFTDLAGDDDPAVRRQAILTLRNAPDEEAISTLIKLAMALNPNDRFYREAIGIASHGRESEVFTGVWEASPEWNAVTAQIAFQLHPPEALEFASAAARDKSLDAELRIVALHALDAIGTPESGDVLASLVGESVPPAIVDTALHHLARDEGAAWKSILAAPAFDKHLRAAFDRMETRSIVLSFIRDTNRPAMIPEILAIAEDTSAPAEQRKQAFATLQRAGRAVDKPTAATIINRLAPLMAPDEALAPDALRALANLAGGEARKAMRDIIANEEKYGIAFRRDAMNLIGRNEGGQTLILTMAELGELPQDLVLDASELLYRSRNEDIRKRTARVLPKPADSEGDPLPPIADLVKMSGDPARGRNIFNDELRAQCSRCHIVRGEGRSVGPNLSTIGAKLSRQAIYESILSPSAAISHEFEVYTLETDWEGDYVGFIQRESDTHYELIDAAGELNRIAKTDIVEKRRNPLSLMPAGLATTMTTQQLVDLAAYLETLK